MASSGNTVIVNPEVVHTQSAALAGQAVSLQTSNAGYLQGLGAASPDGWGPPRARWMRCIAHGTRQGSALQTRLHGTASGMRSAADGLADQDERNRRGIQAVDYVRDIPQAPPETPGVPSDPGYPSVGDERFGQWEPVPPPPPYVGASPPRRHRSTGRCPTAPR